MMKLVVVKVGAPMFDILHALGVAVVLAIYAQQSVELIDKGIFFVLQVAVEKLPESDLAITDILTLPTLAQISVLKKEQYKTPPLSISNLDGLLTALFTVPGIPIVSVDDLLNRQEKLDTNFENCIDKLTKTMNRWQRFLDKQMLSSGRSWIQLALKEYRPDCPASPEIQSKMHIGNSPTLYLTLDPSFGHSLYSSASDSIITKKTNLIMNGATFGTIFAMIGAARFLRAQRVANDLINLYVPSPKQIVVNQDTTLPLLYSAGYFSRQAAAISWLNFFSVNDARTTWQGIHYQTLHPQDQKQSISISREYLGLGWVNSIVSCTGPAVINYWKWLVYQDRRESLLDLNTLVEALTQRSLSYWLAHVTEVAEYSRTKTGDSIRLYTILEMREITQAMSNDSKLSDLLRPGTATVRWGHILRQLGDVNNDALQELLDNLRTVQTPEEFATFFWRVALKCNVTKTESNFIIRPTDPDFERIIQEVEQFGVKKVAVLLEPLSALRYGSKNTENIDEEGEGVPDEEAEDDEVKSL